MAEQDGLAVAGNEQLGWQGSVECPQCERSLIRQPRMEARGKVTARVVAGIQIRRNLRIVGAGIDLGPILRRLYRNLGWISVKPLVGPDRPRRATLDGPFVAGRH